MYGNQPKNNIIFLQKLFFYLSMNKLKRYTKLIIKNLANINYGSKYL